MERTLGIVFLCIVLGFSSCHTKSLSSKAKLGTGKSAALGEEALTSKFLSEDELLEYVRTSQLIKSNKIGGVPFDTVVYNKVIVYDFEGNLYPYTSIIDRKGKFVPVVSKQQYLTQKQASSLLSSLTKNSSYGEDELSCFIPHFAVVLFQDNKFVSQINICLHCNRLYSDVYIPAQSYHKVHKGTQYEYSINGLSSKGRKTIVDLSLELGFRYGIDTSKIK
jgi:hypothetical protein